MLKDIQHMHVSACFDAVIHLPLKDAVLLSIDKDNVIIALVIGIAEDMLGLVTNVLVLVSMSNIASVLVGIDEDVLGEATA